MDLAYQVRDIGVGRWGEPTEALSEALDQLQGKLGGLPSPYQLRPIGEPFGPVRDLPGTIERIRQRMERGSPGLRLAVRGAELWPRFAIRKTVVSEGPEVIQAAISQLGVDYVWGDEDPRGPVGGAAAGFDCSGLVKWCFAQVGVDFPHKADLIMRDNQVRTFSERPRLRIGHLIFYHYGRLGPGQADHIAIFAGEGMQIDASTSLDAVVHRAVDWDNVLVFGNVPAVTGPG